MCCGVNQSKPPSDLNKKLPQHRAHVKYKFTFVHHPRPLVMNSAAYRLISLALHQSAAGFYIRELYKPCNAGYRDTPNEVRGGCDNRSVAGWRSMHRISPLFNQQPLFAILVAQTPLSRPANQQVVYRLRRSFDYATVHRH
jgi:hypothetical protein